MDRFAEFYLRISMSMTDAAKLLGVPYGASQAEIDKAYKALAFELHPDRPGGDEEKFKELGIAKATLEGTAKPTYDNRSDPGDDLTPTQPAYKKPPTKVVTFDEAKSKAGVPSGVDWLFVTPTQRGTSYSSDEFDRNDRTFVAYGRTDSKHVFVAARHYEYRQMFYGSGADEDTWSMKSFEYPIKGDEATNPAWLYGNVVKALKDLDFHGKFNSKVLNAQGWKFDDRLPSGAETSIKHWLVKTKQVAGDAPSVAGRKQVIELWADESLIGMPKPGYYPEPKNRTNFWNGEYHGRYYKLKLIINGEETELNEDDTVRFLGLHAGNSTALDLIFGRNTYKAKKVLTRMPKGKKIIEWMVANFKGLPDDAMASLTAAAAQMKG